MTVPVLSMVCIGVSILLSIGVPIGLFIFFRNRYKIKILPVLVGMAAFVIFALILEQIVHIIILKPDAAGNIALKEKPILYMLYAGFMAGTFEETARFICYKLLIKKYNSIKTALSYAIGHGGIEAILVGSGMIGILVVSFTISPAAIESVPQLAVQLAALSSSAPYTFLIAGGERMLALCLQISLSVIVWYAVAKKGKWWLWPTAILLHAIVDFPAALGQAGALKNGFIIEGLIFVMAVLLGAIAFYIHKRMREDSIG